MKTNISIYPLLISLLLLLVLLNCKKKETLATLPTVTTDEATNIGPLSATFGGKVTSDGGSSIIAQGVCWGTKQNPTLADSKYSITGTSVFSFMINFNPGMTYMTYYIRAFATNAAGTAYGNQVTFTTSVQLPSVQLPSVTTSVVTSLTATTATGGGINVSNGGGTITACGVCWSTSHNPTTANNITIDVIKVTYIYDYKFYYFTSSITGLIPKTAYYLRAYATNSAGTGYGDEFAFETDETSGPTVADIDGNVYHTVTIGTQVWMVENLKTTKYRTGGSIPNILDATAWGNLTSGAYCNFDSDANYSTIYGRLYNWYAVIVGQLAPAGWHVPSDAEWSTLTNWLTNNGYGNQGSGSAIAKSMAARSGWDRYFSVAGEVGFDLLSNNKSGFTALPGGFRNWQITGDMYNAYYKFFFTGLTLSGGWWSSTATAKDTAVVREITSADSIVYKGNFPKTFGFSVRCVKD